MTEQRLAAVVPRVTLLREMLEMLERVRGCADRSGRPGVTLLATVACGLVLTLAGCSGSSGTAAAASPGSPYTLMQMNLCLSGLASCYRKVAYPAGVQEAIAVAVRRKGDANFRFIRDTSMVAYQPAGFG